MTDSKTTQERKEVKEAYKLKINNENVKLRDQVKELQSALKILSVKHNALLDAIGQIGLNLQIICTNNKFLQSKS